MVRRAIRNVSARRERARPRSNACVCLPACPPSTDRTERSPAYHPRRRRRNARARSSTARRATRTSSALADPPDRGGEVARAVRLCRSPARSLPTTPPLGRRATTCTSASSRGARPRGAATVVDAHIRAVHHAARVAVRRRPSTPQSDEDLTSAPIPRTSPDAIPTVFERTARPRRPALAGSHARRPARSRARCRFQRWRLDFRTRRPRTPWRRPRARRPRARESRRMRHLELVPARHVATRAPRARACDALRMTFPTVVATPRRARMRPTATSPRARPRYAAIASAENALVFASETGARRETGSGCQGTRRSNARDDRFGDDGDR